MNVISRYTIRPDRIVFYKETSKEEVDAFYNGVVPEEVARYKGAFGTYGNPNLFIIDIGDVSLKVIGIEYRPDDDRIDYPKDLESIALPKGFFRYETLMEDSSDELCEENIMDHIDELCRSEVTDYRYVEGNLAVKAKPDVIRIDVTGGHCRLMIAAEYSLNSDMNKRDEDNSPYKELYFKDTTTDGHNWNYIWPRISRYCLHGIQDYALAYFDIKDFKAVNIVYGHLNGNDLLRKISKTMEKLDWVYCSGRCDNDNFAMLIRDMTMEETREKLEAFFESVSTIDADNNYKVFYRCGVVPMRSTIELGNIVADAGKQAKAFGTKPFKTEIIFYTDEMRENQDRAVRLRSYLDTAIERDEFLVYLQPKFDILTEKIRGAEALIRWKYKGNSMLSPGIFIPMFEEGGLISKIDDIVLNKVCYQLKKWENEGKNLYPVSVNVSRKSIAIPDLVEHLTEIVDSYGVDHSLIDFELTESAAYDNQQEMIDVISKFKERGFRTSMDDFGTGYSSLSLLPIMHFDTLKIDKMFVDRIGDTSECSKSRAVVKHIIALAKDMGLTCLAEGAEKKEQVDLLREYGCEIIQGYYYSKPLPVEEFEKYL